MLLAALAEIMQDEQRRLRRKIGTAANGLRASPAWAYRYVSMTGIAWRARADSLKACLRERVAFYFDPQHPNLMHEPGSRSPVKLQAAPRLKLTTIEHSFQQL